MRATILIIIIVLLALITGVFYFDIFRPNPEADIPVATSTQTMDVDNLIHVFTPKPGQYIASPFNVTGEARGYWYFEASFPVKLLNASGTVIARGIAQAEDEWMTEDFVPFKTTLEWKNVPAGNGTLVFERDNPSGKPENDRSIEIPVSF